MDEVRNMHLYVIKKRFTNTYYTVRNLHNIPAIIAFPHADPAKTMLKTITAFDTDKKSLVVEKVDGDFFTRTCKESSQPVLLFKENITFELDASVDAQDAPFYFENKYRYY
jgi:hypothetical protein